MMTAPTIPDLFKTIRRIQISSVQLANDALAGAYRSAFRGKGMEFEDVREYQPGDEIRSIDWNVTARMNHPYIKNFREERELTVLLVVDVSASSRFGSRDHAKATLIAEIGAIFAFSAIKNNDKVGLILFSDIVEKYVPPGKGVQHVLRIIRELLAFQPKSKGTDLKGALSFLGKVQNRKGVCFLISDFLCPDFSHEAALIAQRHDLVAICLTDPYESKFPAVNLVALTDLETGKTALIDASIAVQETFSQTAKQRMQQNRHLFKKIGADFINIRTDQPYLVELHKFFKIREKRRI